MQVQILIVSIAVASAMINTGKNSSKKPSYKASDMSIQRGSEGSAGLVFPPPSEFLVFIDESGNSQPSMSDLVEMLRKQKSQSPWEDLFKKIRRPLKPRDGETDEEEQEYRRRRAVSFFSRKSDPSQDKQYPSSKDSSSNMSSSPSRKPFSSKNSRASLAYLRSSSSPNSHSSPSAPHDQSRLFKSSSSSTPNLDKLRKRFNDVLTDGDGSRRVGVEMALSFGAGLAFACFVMGVFMLVRALFSNDDEGRKDIERGGYGAIPSEEDELMHSSPSRRMHKKFRPKL